MLKKSLIAVFVIVFIYICQALFLRSLLTNTLLGQFIAVLFMWTPGLVALYYARKEKKPLAIFSKPNKTVWLIPVYTFGICLIAFLLTLFFGVPESVHPALGDQPIGKTIGLMILMFFATYLLSVLLFFFIFLGEELYWRGFLWDHLKKRGPMKAIFWIAGLWIIWNIPLAFFSYAPSGIALATNILVTILLNGILTPILIYFRVKGRSIYASALFYSSLMAVFVSLMMLFPSTIDKILIFGGIILCMLVLFSIVLKLYSPSRWKKLLKSPTKKNLVEK